VAKLIGSVTVSRAEVQPGQSVRVQVLDPSGNPYGAGSSASADVLISINGIPTASRYFQFPTPGKRTISVHAAQNEITETAVATVNVAGTPIRYRRAIADAGTVQAPGQIPFLTLDQNLSHPYQVTFSLRSPRIASAAAARGVAEATKAQARKPRPAAPVVAQTPPAPFVALQALFQNASSGTITAKVLAPLKSGDMTLQQSTQHLVLSRPLVAPKAATSYVWTFGDGQTATTTAPTVFHDYFGSIQPGRVPFAFDVSCLIVHDNITVTRTLVLYSPYGMCQRNSTIVPHVEGDTFAVLNSDQSSFAASLLVYNIEPIPMMIDKIAIVPVSDDPGATFSSVAFTQMLQAVTIAPRSSTLLAVRVLKNDLASTAGGMLVTGFIVQFEGTLVAPAVAGPRTVGRNLMNRLNPANLGPISAIGAPKTVRFSRHVRLRLRDRELPRPPGIPIKQPPFALGAIERLENISDPIVRPGGQAIDPATNVISIALAAQRPTPIDVAQVGQSVLSILNTANASRINP